MANNQVFSEQKQLVEIKGDLVEALKLVEISRSLFQKKLATFKEALTHETDKDKLESLVVRAKELYREYEESLKIIETYMDISYQKLQS